MQPWCGQRSAARSTSLERSLMSEQRTITRKDRLQDFLKKAVYSHRDELAALEAEPRQFLVAEYDSDDLAWFYTKDSLVECKQQIDAGSSRDVSVFDLDSGREYRVVSCSPRGSSSSRAAECAVFSNLQRASAGRLHPQRRRQRVRGLMRCLHWLRRSALGGRRARPRRRTGRNGGAQ